MQTGAIVYVSPTFDILGAIVTVLVLWIVASIPLYFASKVVVHDRSQLIRALAATLAGAIVFSLFSLLFSLIFLPLGFLIGFIGVLFVLMIVYHIGAGRAFVLAILEFIMFLVASLLLALAGVSLIFIHLV
jgi:hypothetical protein